jgi:glycosyltransferase involved in cell wall biosynthesis
MKILAIVSSIDLSRIGGGIPVTWQFLKGFHDAGVQVLVTSINGTSFSTPWWRTCSRPPIQSDALDFALNRGLKLNQRAAGYFYYRGWKKQLQKILASEKDIEMILLIGAARIAKTIPSWIRKTFGIPTIYYETDIQNIPKYSLDHQPEKHPFPDFSDCDAVACSFEQISVEFREQGLPNVWTVPFGADPAVFAPMPDLQKDIDVFFSGYSELDREDWMTDMISKPSTALSASRFVVEGSFGIDLGNSEKVASVSLDRYLQFCCSSKLNLNILRQQFITAGVLNSRIFELASLGCCVITNPSDGLKEFFEPNKEIVVVSDANEAVDKYNWLLSSEEDRLKVANAARLRILREHTYVHRVHQLLGLMKNLKM